MHIRKRTLSLLLALILAVTALPAAVLATDTADASVDTAETVTLADPDETAVPAESVEPDASAEVTNPSTDAEIQAALETYDDSIDDPEYQKAYEAHQKWLEQQNSPQTFATGANPYTGKTYTHKHAKTKYIYDGIDVSKWQGTINWTKVKADGIDFAFIRCGNTSLSSFTMNTDSKFATNVKNAYAAGVKVGVYYYSGATSATEAKKEANFVLDLIAPYKSKITLPVVMDYETNGSDRIYSNYKKTSKATRTTYVKNFCAPLVSAGYQGGVYASKAWLTDFFNMSDLTAYSTWVAQWSTSTSYANDYDFWQYSDAGDVNGISTAVDCNFWYTDTNLSGSDTVSDATALTSTNTTVTLGYSTIPYSGSAKKPSVEVVYDGTTLVSGTDYTVTYSNNKEPGTATVKVTGIGDYSGTLSKTFKITALTTPYVTTGKVNYRTGCGTSYTKKGSVAKGKSVNVVYGWYKTVSGVKWYKVKIGSSYYYMSGNYLSHEALTKYAATIKLSYRSGAGTKYAVKGKFTKGSDVQVVKGWSKKVSGATWYKVKVGSSYYYVMAKYLSKQETTSRYTTKSKVNLRSDAGSDKTLKATLMTGTPVVVVAGGKKTVDDQVWYKVKVGTSYYYIMASYLVKS